MQFIFFVITKEVTATVANFFLTNASPLLANPLFQTSVFLPQESILLVRSPQQCYQFSVSVFLARALVS